MKTNPFTFLVASFVFSLLVAPFAGMRPALAAADDRKAVSGGTWTFSADGGSLKKPASQERGNGNLAVGLTETENEFTLSANAKAVATDSAWNDFSVVFGFKTRKT